MNWATPTCPTSVGRFASGPASLHLNFGKVGWIRLRTWGPDLLRLVLGSLVAGWRQSFFSEKQLAALRHLFQRKNSGTTPRPAGLLDGVPVNTGDRTVSEHSFHCSLPFLAVVFPRLCPDIVTDGEVGLFFPPEKRCLSEASCFFQGKNNPTSPVPPPNPKAGAQARTQASTQKETKPDGNQTRHPQQSHRLPALDLRIPGLAPVLLRQTDHRHHLVLHVRAVLHRLDHRPVSDPQHGPTGRPAFSGRRGQLQHQLDSAHLPGGVRRASHVHGQVDYRADLPADRRFVLYRRAVRLLDPEYPGFRA